MPDAFDLRFADVPCPRCGAAAVLGCLPGSGRGALDCAACGLELHVRIEAPRAGRAPLRVVRAGAPGYRAALPGGRVFVEEVPGA